MPYVKIKEVRAKYEADDLRVAVTYRGVEHLLHTMKFSPARLTAIVQVSNTGRACFWEENRREFATSKAANPKTGVPETGKVTAWDVRVRASGDVELFARVGTRRWFRVPCTDADLAAAVALLTSPSCRSVNGALTNTEFDVP